MNMDLLPWYLTLLVSGLLLIAAEVFVPGGVLGILGGLALIGALFLGFFAIPSPFNLLAALAILLGAGAFLFLWIRYFPRTRFGRKMTLSMDGKTFKATDDCRGLVGQTGHAESTLRPAGIATLEGKRVDVLAESGWIEAGSPVRVIRATGNAVTVREITGETEPHEA